MKSMKRLFLVLLFFSGCAGLTPINDMPNIVLGEPSFYPTLAAHTDASIIAGNRVELLLNGDQIFPAMLQAIRGARKSITYAQYLYEDGAIAYELAEAFAERCRGGVEVKILLDSRRQYPSRYPGAMEKIRLPAGVVRTHQGISIHHAVGAFKL
jgi:phosphatidylserine/phosphatidylglycerophosphate/cardiolipin synthase-like enzyme